MYPSTINHPPLKIKPKTEEKETKAHEVEVYTLDYYNLFFDNVAELMTRAASWEDKDKETDQMHMKVRVLIR